MDDEVPSYLRTFYYLITRLTELYLNTSVGALGSSERSTIPLMASRGTDVKKKDAPKSTMSSSEMKNVPTGPTLPPSAVSKPG